MYKEETHKRLPDPASCICEGCKGVVNGFAGIGVPHCGAHSEVVRYFASRCIGYINLGRPTSGIGRMLVREAVERGFSGGLKGVDIIAIYDAVNVRWQVRDAFEGRR